MKVCDFILGGAMIEDLKSEAELYDRVKPALFTKKEEMRRNGFPYIKEEDIWNYLKEKKWVKERGLSLYQMVDDILNSDSMLIDDYLKSKLNLRERKRYFEERD